MGKGENGAHHYRISVTLQQTDRGLKTSLGDEKEAEGENI